MTKISPQLFGQTIRKARLEMGLGLRESAAKMGLNHGYLSNLEQNHRGGVPSESVLRKISKLYRLDLMELRSISLGVSPLTALKSRASKQEEAALHAVYLLIQQHGAEKVEEVVNQLQKALAS